jgi:hypothetical protein
MGTPIESSTTLVAIISTVAILLIVTAAILYSVRRGTISPRGAAAAILSLGVAVVALLALVLLIHAQVVL